MKINQTLFKKIKAYKNEMEDIGIMKVKRALGLMTAAVMICNMLSVNDYVFAANDTLSTETGIEYMEGAWDNDLNEVIYTEKAATDCIVVEDNSTEAVTWETGCYVVHGTVNITQSVTVSGDVKLILADDCTLNAESGIIVTTGNSLYIYAQSEGSGILNATGVAAEDYNAGAGIGGSIESADCGTIHIHGGIINAAGGSDSRGWYGGTGIGGGSLGFSAGGNGGSVTIYGGIITAHGGHGSLTGSGIGGGYGGVYNEAVGGDSGEINIYGGIVTAESYGTSEGSGAGIGGGASVRKNGGNGNNIRIYGGVVKATGGQRGAGIGGGSSSIYGKGGDGTSIIISGGQVTAVGGKFAAGIGGGGGYYYKNSYGATTDIKGGVGTSIGITGGIVDARGGDGNSFGKGGMSVGNGGNQEAQSDVIRSDAIIFENSEGLVYGDVVLNEDYVMPDDSTLTVPSESTLKGSGTLIGGGDLVTEKITEDAIIIPEELYYTGEDMTEEVSAAVKIADKVIICNREFTVSSSDGWEKSINPQIIKDAGEYTVTFTKDGEEPLIKTFNVKQSGTALESTVHVFNGETESLSFSADDTITIKAFPKVTGEAPRRAASRMREGLRPDEMAIFYTDGVNEIQLSEAETMNVDGSYIMTCSASDVMGVIEGLPSASETITLTVKYAGNNNMSSADTTVDVTISATAQVTDETSGEVSYVSLENFVAAFPGYGDTDVKKTIIMLDDLTMEAADREFGWASELIYIGGSVTLNLNNHSVVCTNSIVFHIGMNGNLTVVGDGEIIGEEGINIGEMGAADIRGGTIIGTPFYGILVQNDGKLKVSEGAEIKSTNDSGLCIHTRTEVSLSGGTFSGKDFAIEYKIMSDNSMLNLLDTGTDTKYAFFHGDTPVNENLDGKSSGDVVSIGIEGVVTIKPCTHIWEAQHISDTTTHNFNCFACGSTKAVENCSYEFNTQGTKSHGVCECGSIVKVALNDTENIIYNGDSHTPDVTVMLNENELEAENYTVEYTDNVNKGKADVSITGTNGYNFTTNTEFEILPARLTVTSAAATDREYNGTKVVDVTDVTLEGIFGNDDVAADTFELKGTISKADVGQYSSITLPEMTLTGMSKDNYILINPENAVSTNVNITRAAGTLTIPDTVISKNFGDMGISLGCTTNGDGKITYSSDNENVAVISQDGSIEIKGAGSALITVSLIQGKNYTGQDSQTVNVNIEKAAAPVLASEAESYIYTVGSNGPVCINISDKLPDNRGETQYSVETSDTDSILSDVDVDENGELNFTVLKDKAVGSTATISVTAEMSNYNNAIFTMNIVLTDKNAIELKEGSSVTVKEGKTLIYGESIESLEFNPAIFEDKNTKETVEGILTWKNLHIIPNAGITSAEWIFMPDDSDKYETLEGSIDIVVEKVTPYIATPPMASEITYKDTLESSVLIGGMAWFSETDTTTVQGNFVWKDTGITPDVSDSNATAYTVDFIPSDKENFNSVELAVTLVINPMENAPNMPLSEIKCLSRCKKVEDVVLPEGWAWNEQDKATLLETEKTVTVTAIYVGADKENYKNISVTVEVTRDKCMHENTELRNVVEASCESQGYDGDTYCTDCDELLVKGNDIPELEHNWEESVEKKPTITEKGIMRYTCIRCNQTYTKEIDKLEETTGETSEDITNDKSGEKSESITKDSEKATIDNKKQSSSNPQTGDSLEVGWIILMGAVTVVICISDFFIMRRKKGEN